VYNFFQTARSSSLFASISKIPIDARQQAGYVLLRVLKLFEERERKLRARATQPQRSSSAPRCASPPLVPELR
jgi:hypothetical protein